MKTKLSEFEEPKKTLKRQPQIHEVPGYNFSMSTGEEDGRIDFNFRLRKTLLNKIRYWLFCKFFPFKVTMWEELVE